MLAAFAAGFLPGLDFNQAVSQRHQGFQPDLCGIHLIRRSQRVVFRPTLNARGGFQGSKKLTHFILLHFAADECLRLQPRLSLLFSAAYG